MTSHTDPALLNTVLQLLSSAGFESFAEGLRLLVNEAMVQERAAALQARPYERTPNRLGFANGFKSKTLNTRLGPIEFDSPKVRGDLDFYPSDLEKGLRSEKALMAAMAEMYVQGVSTRKFSAIVEELCGHAVSSSQVSKCTAQLDAELHVWRQRPLGSFPYVTLYARYEKIRHGGQVIDCAVFIAIGINPQGKRSVLGVSVALSEAEVQWRDFLTSLQSRGLHGLQLLVSDAHAGLAAARAAVFPSIPWQNAANSTSSKTPKPSSHASTFAPASPPSFPTKPPSFASSLPSSAKSTKTGFHQKFTST